MAPTIQERTEVRVPKTRAELDAQVSQRNELQSQLRSSEERRAQLAEQAHRTAEEHRGTLTQRISTIDQRNARLEGRLAQLDEAIASGMANPEIAADRGVHVMVEPPHAPIPPVPPFPEGITVVPGFESGPAVHPRVMLMGALVTLSLMALVAWVTWKRAVRRFAGIGSGSADRVELSRLQQSVDTIALEVERISENQRFVTKLMSGKGTDAMIPVETERQRL
jgi:hypothetical protein